MLEFFSWVAALVVLVTAAGLVLSRDWRWSLGLLAAQYFGVFLLLLGHWPLGMATAKLVTGWMAAAALLMTRLGQAAQLPGESGWPQGRLFRLFSIVLVVLAMISVVPSVPEWLPGITPAQTFAGLVLIGLGALHLGMTLQPARVVIGLLTVLAGFEILYSSVENSVLVAAMISALNLLLALVGSYLMLQSRPAEEAQA
jgi:hypothetical protein